MKLTRLSIRNFRGIEHLEVRLDAGPGQEPQPLVVLAGPNACGKTSILEAILVGFGREDLLPRRRRPRDDVQRGATGFLVEMELATKAGSITLQAESDLSGAVQTKCVGNEQTPPPRLALGYFSSWRAPDLVGPVPITAGKRGRRPSRTEENRLWRIKSHFVNLKARTAFEEPPDLIKEESRLPGPLERLNQAWSQFYPKSPHRFEAGVASETVDEGFDFFAVPQGAPPHLGVPVDRLSSGELEVLVFLGSCLLEPLAGGVLLIDEPELHLHPDWQRVLLNAVSNLLPDTQIICATHSPQVLSELPPKQIRLLKRNNAGLTAVTPEDSYGLDANRVLEELMQVPDRPVRVKEDLRKLFDLIGQGEFVAARTLAGELHERVHADPALTKAEMLMRRKEALGR